MEAHVIGPDVGIGRAEQSPIAPVTTIIRANELRSKCTQLIGMAVEWLEGLDDRSPGADPDILLLRVRGRVVVLVDEVPATAHVIVKQHLVASRRVIQCPGAVPYR